MELMNTLDLNQSGFITNYLTSGPLITDFSDNTTDKNQMHYEKYLRSIIADKDKPIPSDKIQLGVSSELGMEWKYYYNPGNWFVDFSQFEVVLKKVELLAATILIAEEDMDVSANLWTYAAVDIWLNSNKICSVTEPVYKPIGKKEMKLSLKKGENLLLIRMQNLGVRDTRNIFGMQILDNKEKIAVTLPDFVNCQPFISLDKWLHNIKIHDNRISFPHKAPADVYLSYNKNSQCINIAQKEFVDIKNDIISVSVYGVICGKKMVRKIELLQNKKPIYNQIHSAEENMSSMFEKLAEVGTEEQFQPLRFGMFYVMARWNLGKTASNDRKHIEYALDQIEQREDCSDFFMAGLLRLMSSFTLPDGLHQRAENAILNYRYWMTEDGSDGMCFWSENHALMFYLCAFMAGKRYPDRLFKRSGRTGTEVCIFVKKKIRQWLEDVEEYGFEEFLSAEYMCVTLGALLNLVDYADAEESQRASKLIDMMLKQFACHTFHGSIIAPQGRIYRSVICPFSQAAQSMVHLVNPDTPYENTEWLVFLMNSKYRVPKNLIPFMDNPLEMEYHTGNAYIKLKKQQDYIMTSVQSPRYDNSPLYWENISFDESVDVESNLYIKSFNERFHGTTRFEPGVYGYQQHMWYAALDNDTVIFTNHPGETADDCGMRPGYWYGNGIMPAIKQEENLLGAIYDIGGNHPIDFTHLFFPEDKFDYISKENHWLFGQKGNGYAAVWCSDIMIPYDDRLFHCEYRVYGSKMAYICQCGSKDEFENLQKFKDFCQYLSPCFNKETLTLCTKSGYTLQYVQKDNKTQYV